MRLFRRSPRSSPPQNRVRLSLESLDLRLSPSSLLDPFTAAEQEGGSQYYVMGDGRTNQAPQIVNFSAEEIVSGMWRFSGDVIDETPGGLTVTLGGEPVSLQNVTVTTDANGHFEIILLLNTDGSDNGLATAQTVDPQGAQSNIAMYQIAPG